MTPDMHELAKLATEKYDHIDSLEQIRPPYPAHGTSNWWALRLRYEQILNARLCRERAGKVYPTEQRDVLAKWTALGHEQSTKDYERDGKSREQWLEGTSEPTDLSAAVQATRRVG